MQNFTDLSYLVSISDDDQNFIDEMVRTFIHETPEALLTMESALSRGDISQAGKIAHRMKPSLVLMGIDALKPLLKQFEAFCEEDEEEMAIALMDEIKNIAISALYELKSMVKS